MGWNESELIREQIELEQAEARRQAEKDLLRSSAFFPGALILILWIIKLLEIRWELDLSWLGVYPGLITGLAGVLTAPLIHGDLNHLFSNTLPLFVLGAGLLYLYRGVAWRVFWLIYILGGVGTWVIGRPSYHIGASLLTYGLVSFIFLSGAIRREPPAIALALIVTFLYGGMVWGVLPIRPGMSWEAHLAGSVVGLLLAIKYRNVDRPPVQEMVDDEDEDDDEYWKE